MASRTFNKIISNIPIAYPFPITTFITRTIDKMLNIQWRYPKLKVFPAATIISMKSNLTYLEFNRETILAEKNGIIVVPTDNYMPKRIAHFGYWSKELSIFLSSGINKNTALLDLGAHCGLVSLQTYNVSFIPKIYAVEPKVNNFTALSENLKKIAGTCEVLIINAAVTDQQTDVGTLYTEPGATMNASINPELPGIRPETIKNIETEIVNTVNSKKLCQNFLEWSNNFFIALKSDMQGMDVRILSQFSNDFWSRVKIGSIEVCSLSYGTDEEIVLFIQQLKRFKNIYLNPELTLTISFSEIRIFYNSKTNKTINLFFKT